MAPGQSHFRSLRFGCVPLKALYFVEEISVTAAIPST